MSKVGNVNAHKNRDIRAARSFVATWQQTHLRRSKGVLKVENLSLIDSEMGIVNMTRVRKDSHGCGIKGWYRLTDTKSLRNRGQLTQARKQKDAVGRRFAGAKHMSDFEHELGEITEILSGWNEAPEESLDKVFPKVYDTLKQKAKKARRLLGRTDPEDTLGTTELVNDLFIKLRRGESFAFNGRQDFYALCLTIMRRTLRDYYYKKKAKKVEVRLPPDSESLLEGLGSFGASDLNDFERAILFDEVLTRLGRKHPRKVEVLVSKYWLGETDEEIARHLGLSEGSVRRDCKKGEALVRLELDATTRGLFDDAAHIPDAVSRQQYLDQACGNNKHLLKHLEILLRRHLAEALF